MGEEDKVQKRNQVALTIFFIATCLVSLIIVCFYLYQFGHLKLGNQEQFGQLGDYIGGLLNPLFTFFTIALLVWSIDLQIKELRNSRQQLKDNQKELERSAEALEQSQKAHSEQKELAAQEALRSQLYDALNHHYAKYHELYGKKVIGITQPTAIGSADIVYHSLKDILETKHLGFAVPDLLADIREKIHDAEAKELVIVTVLEMREQARLITHATHELYGVISSKSVAQSWFQRTSEILDFLSGIDVLTQEEHLRLSSLAKLPERLGML